MFTFQERMRPCRDPPGFVQLETLVFISPWRDLFAFQRTRVRNQNSFHFVTMETLSEGVRAAGHSFTWMPRFFLPGFRASSRSHYQYYDISFALHHQRGKEELGKGSHFSLLSMPFWCRTPWSLSISWNNPWLCPLCFGTNWISGVSSRKTLDC